MRRIFIAIAFLVFTISIGITEFSLVNKSFERYVTALDTAQFFISQGEYNKTIELTETIDKNWESTKNKLNIFLFHEDIELISENIKVLCEQSKLKEKEDYIYLCNKTKRQLLKLKLNELPDLQNIL